MINTINPAPRIIDYDRGVLIRQDEKTGVEVYMYIDDPGRYLTVHGNEVALDLARTVGYPVDDHLRERNIKQRLAKYELDLKKEFEVPEDRKVIKEYRGFKLLELSPDRCQIIAPNGMVMNKGVIPKEDALKLFEEVAPADVK